MPKSKTSHILTPASSIVKTDVDAVIDTGAKSHVDALFNVQEDANTISLTIHILLKLFLI
jgi:hypothetical protein